MGAWLIEKKYCYLDFSDLTLCLFVSRSILSRISTLYVMIRMKFKTVWLWPLIDTLNSSIDWDNLGERLYVTTTAHYVLFKDT